MDAELAAIVRETADRQQIYDCIMRYCLGIDRFDREVVASAYHPGAIDDHGYFVGPAEQFVDIAIALHLKHHRRTQHMITNHYCRLEGDMAHSESYFLFRSLNREAPWHSIFSGRYIDRLERRDGRWGIVARICVVEVRDEHTDPDGSDSEAPYRTTSRDRNDPSYLYPLVIDPARFTG